jgi:hypothetical protein
MDSKRTCSHRIALLVGTFLALGLTTSVAEAQVRDGHFGAMIRYNMTVAGDHTYTIEVRNMVSTVGGVPDSVMYLLNATTGTFLAYDDDGNNAVQTYASKIIYTSRVNANVQVVVASYSATSRGTASLYVNGAAVLTNQNFGGYRWFSNWNANTTVFDTVLVPNGSTDTVLFLIDHTLGARYYFDDDSGLAYGSRMIPSTACTGTCMVLAGSYSSGVEGNARVIRNDTTVDRDSDGDGLSDVVENDPAIRTNPNNVDTDGDGINDYFEVIGKPTNYASGAATYSTAPLLGYEGSLLLPQMGAHPTARDVFVMTAAMTHDAGYVNQGFRPSDGPNAINTVYSAMTAAFNAHNNSAAVQADPSLAVYLHLDQPINMPTSEHADFVILKRHADEGVNPNTYATDSCAAAPNRDVRTLYPGKTFVNFFAIRKEYVPAIRDGIFNFLLYAHNLFDIDQCGVDTQSANRSEARLGNPDKPVRGSNAVMFGATFPKTLTKANFYEGTNVASGVCDASKANPIVDEAMVGLTLHELGHLYGLTHIGNEYFVLNAAAQAVDVSGNSVLHRSIMNYGYGVCGYCTDPKYQPFDPSCPSRTYSVTDGDGPYSVYVAQVQNPETGARLNCRSPSGSPKWKCSLQNPPEWCDCDSADQTAVVGGPSGPGPNPAKADWRMIGTRPQVDQVW